MSIEIELSKAVRSLARRDPVLRALAKRHGPPTFRPHDDYFNTLVESIVSQQISSKAAESILRRLRESLGGFFDPRLIVETPDELLRGAGLSPQKLGYLRALAGVVASGELDLDALARRSDDDVIAELTKIKGIGVWTAQMFLIFSLARLDILPLADLGVRKGMQFAYELAEMPTPGTIVEIARVNGWAPYRSVASWYMWRAYGP